MPSPAWLELNNSGKYILKYPVLTKCSCGSPIVRSPQWLDGRWILNLSLQPRFPSFLSIAKHARGGGVNMHFRVWPELKSKRLTSLPSVRSASARGKAGSTFSSLSPPQPLVRQFTCSSGPSVLGYRFYLRINSRGK